MRKSNRSGVTKVNVVAIPTQSGEAIPSGSPQLLRSFAMTNVLSNPERLPGSVLTRI